MARRAKIDWKKHCHDYPSSGMKMKDYCTLHGLNLGSFRVGYYKNRDQPIKKFREYSVGMKFTVSIDGEGNLSLSGISPEMLPAIISACSNALQ